jgi:hypothetical protein
VAETFSIKGFLYNIFLRLFHNILYILHRFANKAISGVFRLKNPNPKYTVIYFL